MTEKKENYEDVDDLIFHDEEYSPSERQIFAQFFGILFTGWGYSDIIYSKCAKNKEMREFIHEY